MKKALLIIVSSLGLALSQFASAAEHAKAEAKGDADAGKGKSQACAACHNADGNSTNPEWPRLAGQSYSYLYKQLKEFKAGIRENALMAPMVAPLNDQDMKDLAAYFSSQKAAENVGNPDLVEKGRLIYKGGILSKKIAACSACHGPTGSGNPAAKYPRIGAQHAKYVSIQLNAFKKGQRSNDNSSMMRDIAKNLSDDEIAAVAEYIAGLR